MKGVLTYPQASAAPIFRSAPDRRRLAITLDGGRSPFSATFDKELLSRCALQKNSRLCGWAAAEDRWNAELLASEVQVVGYKT